MKQTFELESEQVTAIIINELKDAHRINSTVMHDEGGYPFELDFELLDAIESVLAYYMVPYDFDDWKKEVYGTE